MEHNEIQWLGAPSCQRGTFSFYKSVSSRSGTDGPLKVWKLGEFYFIRCGPEDPVCIAEVTLLWEDQTQHHLLACARLYFLPEDTPRGRTREHGEDEVLAVSRKMVVRVEDLVKWSCLKPSSWIRSQKQLPLSCETNSVHKPPQKTDSDGDDVPSENNTPVQQDVKVLSYPQYCRFRSLQRRVQDAARAPGLQDPHLLALGAVKALPDTRLMYCRDTFNHPTLESSTIFSWQFRSPSLSLRGRPRKRRGRDGKDSPPYSQSESWIEKMKENVMGSVEMGCESSWLPHPEEQLFLDQLYTFMDQQGSPISKVPNLGFKKIDLFLMFSVVRRLGGYKKVTTERLWKCVYNELGGCPGSTSAATCTRKHYERLILPYEEHLRTGGTEFRIPQSPSPPKPRGIRGRKPLPRGRKPGPKPKEKTASTSTSTAITSPPCAAAEAFPPTVVKPDSVVVVVKRGRGRPPGTRNKTTLLTQAKLLTPPSTKAPQSPSLLIPPRAGVVGGGAGGETRPSSTHRSPVVTVNLPLTPDLSPMSTSFLPFPLKPKELKPERAESTLSAQGLLLSTLPPHVVGGSLGGFSPIKGICPLDVFRNRFSLQRAPESPAVTPQDPTMRHPSVYTGSSPDAPPKQLRAPSPGLQQHGRCSGVEEVAQVGVGCRDGRLRSPLPPLRVLPLNLDCSVQVCQLMKARRLDPSQLQSFTRRLSEALSQDLGPKPPCSPITPPPEQALPLNLSKRFVVKRPSAEVQELFPAQSNGGADQLQSTFSKRPRAGVENSTDFHQGPKSSSTAGSGAEVEKKNPEEPADLSSPSRIRAFLLGLPPFQVKLEEDLNGGRFGKFHPAGSDGGLEQPEGGASAVKMEAMSPEEAVETDSGPAHSSGPGPGTGPVAMSSKSNCF